MSIGITQVLINDDSDRTITGIISYDRDNDGVLVVPAGAVFPSSSLTPGELFYKTDENTIYRRNDANTTWVAIESAPNAHAPSHIQGGADEIDADQLDIDFTPANYTPITTPPEVSDVDHLSAHLAGIDAELDSPLFESLITDINTNIVTTTAEYNPGNPPTDGLLTRATLNFTIAEAGVYRLDYAYTWNHDSQSDDFVAVIYLDNTQFYLHRQEPKDSAGTSLGGSGTDQVHPASGFILFTLNPATYTITFAFGTSDSSDESTLFTSYLMFYRVS
jgi:hypothetical protein